VFRASAEAAERRKGFWWEREEALMLISQCREHDKLSLSCPWCYVSTGWLPCGSCSTSPNGGGNSICANQEGAALCHICARKFHDFMYGRQATIETDHKLLTAIVEKPPHLVPLIFSVYFSSFRGMI